MASKRTTAERIAELVGSDRLRISDASSRWPILAEMHLDDGVVPLDLFVRTVILTGRPKRNSIERRIQNPGKDRPIQIKTDRLPLLLGLWEEDTLVEVQRPVLMIADASKREGKLTRFSVFVKLVDLQRAANDGRVDGLNSDGEQITCLVPEQLPDFVAAHHRAGKARAVNRMSTNQASYETMTMNPLEIQLDPENPRLHPEERNGNQDQLRETLLKRFKLQELGESIVASGYTPMDPLIGIEKGGEIFVREGNRRISTLQLLLKPDLAPDSYRKKWQELSNSIAERRSLERVEIRVYKKEDLALVESYIGFRHVSGVLEWPAQEKARFIDNMVTSHGWSYRELAKRLGSYPKHIERHYIAIRLIEQAVDEGIDGALNIQIGVLLRALQTRGVSEYLGVDYPGDPEKSRKPILENKIDDFRFFVWATFGSEERPAILPESRELTRWGRILQAPRAVSYLKKSKRPRFKRAWLKSGGEEETLVEMLNGAADHLEDSLPLIPVHRDQKEVEEAVERCSQYLSQILRDFKTIRKDIFGGSDS